MKNKILILLVFLCSMHLQAKVYRDGFIKYGDIQLTDDEKQIVEKFVMKNHQLFDPKENMLTIEIKGYNYHTDATTAKFHYVVSSLRYAVSLLDLNEPQYEKRAFDVIRKCLTLQEKDTLFPYFGVWPYYLEEPLSTKRSKIDYNMADFNIVSLLDIYTSHYDRLPEDLKADLEKSLILGAKSIQKRDCPPTYTNISLKGSFCTYMISHMFNLKDMQDYSKKRIIDFYNFTLLQGNFTEYNSPAYSLDALDELQRMKNHFLQPEIIKMVDYLYEVGWNMVASHFHVTSGQWSGPHCRTYHTILQQGIYGIFKQASDGLVDFGYEPSRPYVKLRHQMPQKALKYFTNPVFPRTQIDTFSRSNPLIVGTTELTKVYSIGTVNKTMMWNQRRAFLVYWGTVKTPKYMHVRFLKDDYDFCSANMDSKQDKSAVLAGFTFTTSSGDKHYTLDKLENGTFKAKDLRLRFEFGNCKSENINLPKNIFDTFTLSMDSLEFNFKLLNFEMDNLTGKWSKGFDEKNGWLDFVLYSGPEKEFDLKSIEKAYMALAFSLNKKYEKPIVFNTKTTLKDGKLKVKWNKSEIEIPVKPIDQIKYYN